MAAILHSHDRLTLFSQLILIFISVKQKLTLNWSMVELCRQRKIWNVLIVINIWTKKVFLKWKFEIWNEKISILNSIFGYHVYSRFCVCIRNRITMKTVVAVFLSLALCLAVQECERHRANSGKLERFVRSAYIFDYSPTKVHDWVNEKKHIHSNLVSYQLSDYGSIKIKVRIWLEKWLYSNIKHYFYQSMSIEWHSDPFYSNSEVNNNKIIYRFEN